MRTEPGITPEEQKLLTTTLTYNVANPAKLWAQVHDVLDRLLIRMGREHEILDLLARFALPGSMSGVWLRIGLATQAAYVALLELMKRGPIRAAYHQAGLYRAMEATASAGYSTFALEALVNALDKSKKMQLDPVQRMKDTFEFTSTMLTCFYDDPKVEQQIQRVLRAHAHYGVAGNDNKGKRDFFKYIALNMFYIGFRRRPDITPEERWALCTLTILVSKRMGHEIEASVLELDEFIADYETKHFFRYDDPGPGRKLAMRIAKASRDALVEIPTVSAERIDAMVPHGVKRILGLV